MPDRPASPWSRLTLPLVLSLTLGLAPFTPEPHIVGKLRWIAGGAVGMGPMDWFDVALHGTPWVFLGVTLVSVLRDVARGPADTDAG